MMVNAAHVEQNFDIARNGVEETRKEVYVESSIDKDANARVCIIIR